MDSNCIEVETCTSDVLIVPNAISSVDSLNCMPVPFNEIPSSVTPPKNQKKRVRKRTHKKSKQQVEPIEFVKNVSQYIC